MKKIFFLYLLSLPVYAADNCILQDKTVVRNSVTIVERSPIRKDVVPMFNNQKKCVVDFKVRINLDWHTAYGEHVWSGARPDNEACAVAVLRAEDEVRQRVGQSQTISEKILLCKDQPKLETFPKAGIGTVGDIGQFRPHPEYPNRFYHNGTQCRWFVDTNFVNKDIRTFQGIVCQIEKDRWVVVDKF